MYQSFLSTRRVTLVLGLSLLACVVLLLLFGKSYGIGGVNEYRDTPLARLLPVLLGALAGSAVHPVAPSAEATAPTRLLHVRAITLSGLMIAQILIILVCIAALGSVRDLGVTTRDGAILVASTVFWQGLCCLCTALTAQMKAWFLPLLVLLVLLLYPWKSWDEPYPWNMLLTINPYTITANIVVLAGALVALATVDTTRIDNRR